MAAYQNKAKRNLRQGAEAFAATGVYFAQPLSQITPGTTLRIGAVEIAHKNREVKSINVESNLEEFPAFFQSQDSSGYRNRRMMYGWLIPP